MANPTANTPHIDIVSDVMCPWCVIGYCQLAKALEASGSAYEIQWHPFELNPDMSAGGQNLREHIAEKYGATPAQSQQNHLHMTQAGKDVGFTFNFADDMRMHNTFNVHQLLHWATPQGRMHDLKQALFVAHFSHHRNLSDNSVLADVAAEMGLDRGETLAVLADQRFASAVRTAEKPGSRWASVVYPPWSSTIATSSPVRKVSRTTRVFCNSCPQ